MSPKYPPDNGNYARPSETVEFQLSTTTHEQVTYVVDFNDTRSPHRLTTTDDVVAHAWASASNYSVNFTAVTPTNSATRILTVQIYDVVEGQPPENLAIKPDIDRRHTSP